jgi:serine protease
LLLGFNPMRKLKKLALLCSLGLLSHGSEALAAPAEWNPVHQHPVDAGPQADRLIVGFKTMSANNVVKSIKLRGVRTVQVVQAQTSEADIAGLAQRAGLLSAASRQLTPSMHVVFLPKALHGVEVAQTLQRLRSDPRVAFAEVDERRYVHATPNDPLFQPGANATGQWFMLTPSTLTPTSDWSATDAVSAWNITQGSSGTVIADVDSGFRFDHPDLGRAGFGGRLLPGYDFVGHDYSSTAALSTFLTANDGDGWDPDPSDPGDWIDSTDLMNTAVFPSSRCMADSSSWHGTRVAGVLGAVTNNNVGVAGMTWNPYILPVRALGKCGGYDSDIIAGIQWAAGMSIAGVPDNPYPADIINLSLGGSGSCPASYQSVIDTLTTMGVIIVASAGNGGAAVDTPGNCPGVLAVGGLRNVGTKVGYSSFGPEVGISAPAGNCVNTSGACLRSIDTTVNEGATTPGVNSYTDQLNPNLGTSFSAPIVSGVVALMRAVNGNLTPGQLITRIKSSASAFPPNTGALPVCPSTDAASGECSCVTTQCGAGMVNAFSAVKAALNPIAAVKIPAGLTAGSATFDGSQSAAACNQTVAGYAWTVTGGVTIAGAANGATVSVNWNGGTGTLTLIVTDAAGNTDAAVVNFAAGGASTSAPASAGTSATACPTPMTFSATAPTVTPAFSPASVSTNTAATLTLTLANANPFVLTQSALSQSLPSGLTIDSTTAPSTTCTGANVSLTNTSSGVSLSNANIPANASCSITLSVKSASAAGYTVSVAASALSTGPAGSNTAVASATLTVTAPAHGGGGDMDVFDILLVAGVLLVARGKLRRSI